MEVPKLTVVSATFTSLLLLLSCAKGLAGVERESDSHRPTAGHRIGVEAEWQILTKRNFSTQIRLHPHLLLMVTLPWSGESRALMKEVALQVSDKQEKLGHLRLMVLYRNSEKILADVLGATQGITLLYYHHSKPFKYKGRLRAQTILASVFHLMSLPPDEVPLKRLNSKEEVEDFILSTDKAVLLFEFCGWSARLLHQKDNENKEHSPSQVLSDYGGILGENFTSEAGQTIPLDRKENQKGSDNEKLTCGVEDELNSTPWVGGLKWTNESASLGFENRSAGAGISCTVDGFQQYESFFSKFIMLARENFLPPERQKFGLISMRSLLPILGVGNQETWLLVLWFSGCPNCTKVFQEGDELRTTLQMQRPLVVELGGDHGNQEAALPANRPSLILFIDRSSEILKVREQSRSALENFRKFAQHIQPSNQMFGAQDSDIFVGSSRQAYSGTQSTQVPRMVKLKDNRAFMIIKEGESYPLVDMADDFKDNHAYDFLTKLLHQKNPVLKLKETKISLLAKEVGFQLLSDDFEVQLVDAMPSDEENDQSSSMVNSAVIGSEDPRFETSQETIERNVKLKSGDSLISASINTVKDRKQPELLIAKTCNQHHREAVLDTESNTKLVSKVLDQETLKSKLGVASATGVNEDDDRTTEKEFGLSTCPVENSVHFQQDTIEGNNEKFCSINDTRSHEFSKDSSDNYSDEALVVHDVTEGEHFQLVGKSKERKYYNLDFVYSFFFSDGEYELLGALSAGFKIPTMVILDPVRQLHYVISDETDFSYFSLVSVFDKFLNESLTPYRRSELIITSPRETPRPPFVNLDFREANAIPRVTADKFQEVVLGSRDCAWGDNEPSSYNHNFFCARERDVLVLFSNSWCGFCQRMEIIVRDVYRAFKGFLSMAKSGSMKTEFVPIKERTLSYVGSISC